MFAGEPCGRLRGSALQWQAAVNMAINITFLGDCQLLQKSLLQAQCPSADIFFPLIRKPRTSCELLNAIVTTINTLYKTGNGTNVLILYYVHM